MFFFFSEESQVDFDNLNFDGESQIGKENLLQKIKFTINLQYF